MIPLSRPWITDAEHAAVNAALDSGWLTDGDVVTEFEDLVASYVGVDYAVAVPNATLGLEAVFKLSGFQKTRVYIPDFTHIATGQAVLNVGSRPILTDVDVRTGNVSEEIVHFVPRNSSFCPVSWAGLALDPAVYDLCYDRNIAVIEDAACSLGAIDSDGAMAGSRARAAVYSFHPRKIITTGEGGVVTTNDHQLASKLREHKDFGWFVNNGTNLKMSNVTAAIGVAQMHRIEDIISERIEIADRYNRISPVVWRDPCGPNRNTYQTYCTVVKDNAAAIATLAEAGIGAQIGTYSLKSDSPLFASCHRSTDLHQSDYLRRHLLSLPTFHGITEDEQKLVVETLGDSFV